MDMTRKLLALGFKYDKIFGKAVDKVNADKLNIWSRKSRKEFKTNMLRARYYQAVTKRIIQELEEIDNG